MNEDTFPIGKGKFLACHVSLEGAYCIFYSNFLPHLFFEDLMTSTPLLVYKIESPVSL